MIFMLKTFFLHPLGPALILLLGGLLLQLGGRRTRPSAASAATRTPFPVPQKRLGARTSPIGPTIRAALANLTFSQVMTLLALLTVALAAADLIWLRQLAARAATSAPAAAAWAASSASHLHWAWQPLAVAGSEMDWWLDGWSWLVALLLLLLTATTLILGQSTPRPEGADLPTIRRIPRTLWLSAAALAFVFSANVLTLASCWVLLDGALALRMRSNDSEQPAGRAWSLLSLSGLAVLIVLLLLGEHGIHTALASGPFDRTELGLLWLAALVRAGVYPFHLWLTGHESLDLGDRTALHLIAPLTGLWLLARVHEVAGPNWLRRPEWAALGALALLGSALAAWTTDDPQRRWRWIAVNRASLVVMAAYIADATGPAALAWALVTFALGLALLGAGQAAREAWGWKWPLWLGVLTVWGLPGTPGFLAHAALVLPVRVPGALLFFGIIVVAETLLMASLWGLATGESEALVSVHTPTASREAQPFGRRATLDGGTVSPVRWSSLLGFSALVLLLAVPTVGWGLAPRQLGSLLGLPAAADQMRNLFQIMLEARRSVWGVLILSGVAGVGLGLYRKQIFAGMRGWQEGISALVGLEWFYGIIALGFALFGSGLRYFANLGEGQGYLGWLMLAALLLWVLLRG
jgi:hypothetical protein